MDNDNLLDFLNDNNITVNTLGGIRNLYVMIKYPLYFFEFLKEKKSNFCKCEIRYIETNDIVANYHATNITDLMEVMTKSQDNLDIMLGKVRFKEKLQNKLNEKDTYIEEPKRRLKI